MAGNDFLYRHSVYALQYLLCKQAGGNDNGDIDKIIGYKDRRQQHLWLFQQLDGLPGAMLLFRFQIVDIFGG